jgi:hypothetical protein
MLHNNNKKDSLISQKSVLLLRVIGDTKLEGCERVVEKGYTNGVSITDDNLVGG